MTEILAIYEISKSPGYWLILACGHWLKWAGPLPRLSHELSCPRCATEALSRPPGR